MPCVEETERQLSSGKRGMRGLSPTHGEILKLKLVLSLCAAFVPVTVAIASTQRGIASFYSTESGTKTGRNARTKAGS